MALAAEPKLLIADEPTTGLDVTTQKVIMDTLYELGASEGLATLLITHDVGLAARYCRRIAVMCDGKMVETGSTADVLERSRIAYTQRLVAATPRVGRSLIDLLPPASGARSRFTAQPDNRACMSTVLLRCSTFRASARPSNRPPVGMLARAVAAGSAITSSRKARRTPCGSRCEPDS